MDQSLLVFVTVAEKQSFTRAADALHMTQPAVSQYIQTLEKNLGVKLLDRNNKYVQLNKAGEIVFHHANEIIGLYTQMQTLLDDTMNKASGNLAIGASYTFGEYVLPHIVAYLQDQIHAKGLIAFADGSYLPCGYALPRAQEIYSCFNRYRR